MNSHQLSLSTCTYCNKIQRNYWKNVYFHGKIAKFFTVSIGQTAAHDVTGIDGCMYLSQPIYLQCDSRQPIPGYSLDYN